MKMFVVALGVLLLTACTNAGDDSLDAPRKFFAENKIGSSVDYGIIKMGDLRNHVITVHGFTDDFASCKEVVEALNTNACKELGGQNCLDPYSCVPLNQ